MNNSALCLPSGPLINTFVFRCMACIVFIMICHISLFGQDSPLTWGDIPRADLEMKSYPADTNASAVVLCDYGESHIDDEMDIVFTRHVRVKILTAKGYSWGSFVIPLYSKDDIERIKDIQGATYYLDESNSINKKELDDNNIYHEKKDENRTEVRFALPALRPGCIVEVRFTIESSNLWFIHDWKFQHDEPVLWSEYRITYPKLIAYSAVTSGFEPFAVDEMKDISQIFSGKAVSYLSNRIVPCTQMRWAVKNLPALRDEPFITTIEDYIDKVDVQLAGYAFPGYGVQQVLNTWQKLNEDLLNDKQFGQQIDDTRRIRQLAETIVAGLTSPQEKIDALYSWITKSIVYNGRNRVSAEHEMDEVLDSQKGDNAEITFLLLSLLKSVGIQGDPVILSTRNNGKIQNLYPIVSQFNYVLARVSLGSEIYYLDATDPLRPKEFLPRKVLNVKGLIIKQGQPEWVTLSSPKRYTTASLAMITLHDDGSFHGSLEDAYREYAGIIQRRSLEDKKDIEIAKEAFEPEQTGMTLDSVTVEGRDSIQAALKMKAWVTSPSYAQRNGNLLYINPHILHRTEQNPFKDQDRKFPIDYSYLISSRSVTVLTIPEGYSVKEGLYNRKFTAGAEAVTYSRIFSVDGNRINIAMNFDVKESIIKQKYYGQLKELYSQIIRTESEQLVLEKMKSTEKSSSVKSVQGSGNKAKSKK